MSSMLLGRSLRASRLTSIKSALSLSSKSFSCSAIACDGANAGPEIQIPLAALNSRTVTGDPTLRNFFKYTWGTWLTNDAGEKAKRETPFNSMGLVEILNKELSPKDKNSPIEIKSIAAYSEGKHHKVYKLDIKNVDPACKTLPNSHIDADGSVQLVLRIPYPGLGSYAFRAQRLESEVATMSFVQDALIDTGATSSFRIPKVISWASNPKKTSLETQYMLMEFVPGSALMKWWDPASHDLAAKQRILAPVVNAYTDLVSRIPFNKYGSLYFTEDVSSELQNDAPVDQSIIKKLGLSQATLDKYKIGQTTESQFWKNDLPASSPLRGPFNTAAEYIAATGNVLVDGLELALQSYKDTEVKTHLEKQLAAAKHYAEVAPSLFLEQELDPELFSARLAHPDLNPLSFLCPPEVQSAEDVPRMYDPSTPSDKKLPSPVLIDWESTSIKPFLLHGTPFFARHDGLKIFNVEEVPDYEKLAQQDKFAVQHFMALTQNQFSFEYMLMQRLQALAAENQAKEEGKEEGKENTVSSALINAFAPVIKRRQKPIHTAQTKAVSDVTGTSPEYIDLDEDLIALASEWEHLQLNRECPVKYTEQEKDAHAAEFQNYSKELVKNPFIGSKGWIPQDLFEKLLGSGSIKKLDNGDYEIDYKWQLNN